MIILFLAAAVFITDCLIKQRIQRRYDMERCSLFFKKRICICKLYNPGAAMGFMKNHKSLLDIMTLSSILYIFYQLPRVMKRGKLLEQTGTGLILGGALNNACERILKGRVTDYINFPRLAGKLRYIVFNLSDFAILIGGVMTMVGEQMRKRK